MSQCLAARQATRSAQAMQAPKTFTASSRFFRKRQHLQRLPHLPSQLKQPNRLPLQNRPHLQNRLCLLKRQRLPRRWRPCMNALQAPSPASNFHLPPTACRPGCPRPLDNLFAWATGSTGKKVWRQRTTWAMQCRCSLTRFLRTRMVRHVLRCSARKSKTFSRRSAAW